MNQLQEYDNRPPSEQLVDLHVYLVPPELWRDNLNSAINQIVSETVSMGFIRVVPELKLYQLRDEIIEQLGSDAVPHDFVFLKSVGRCLTQVKAKQELHIKVKSFLPPHNYLPEIFLLEASAAVVRALLPADDVSTINTNSASTDSTRSIEYDSPGQHRSKQEPRQRNGGTEIDPERYSPHDNQAFSPTGPSPTKTPKSSDSNDSEKFPAIEHSSHRPSSIEHKATQYDPGGQGDYSLPPLSATPSMHVDHIPHSSQTATFSRHKKDPRPMTNGDSGIAELSPSDRERTDDSLPRISRDNRHKDPIDYKDPRRTLDKNHLDKQSHRSYDRRRDSRDFETPDSHGQSRGHEPRRSRDNRHERESNNSRPSQENPRSQDFSKHRQSRERDQSDDRFDQRSHKNQVNIRDNAVEALDDGHSRVNRDKEKQRSRQREERQKVLEEEIRQQEEALTNLRIGENLKNGVEERLGQTNAPNQNEEDDKSEEQLRQEERDQISKELERVQEDRKEVERKREELVKRAKQMQAKTQTRRNMARDQWKKRYFDEKKRTAPLEEQSSRLRGELEVLHRRLMSHLETGTKDTHKKGAAGAKGGPSEKNSYRVQATKVQHEIEDLTRRVETAKMKLTAEMKLRNQAETELRALRTELTQKKINVTLTRSQQMAALGSSQDLYSPQSHGLSPRS
ncbi:unnamed protein product [Owenia fusiformis]|uniref:Spermatogenesis-associated protein 1 C-terminal domain-containing protein n=1 Tax=Owenia fusiformis TaxID=6347 RepID=A0A8S4N427_OWEFU|nr:unnamed protein product [Owenia fusiformis]